MSLATCCCACSSSYRVFVPCSDTATSVDYRAPVMTLTEFNATSLNESTVYLYEDVDNDCDEYCGTWQCVSNADDSSNRCHPDGSGGLSTCPGCFDWNGTLDAPYRFIRPLEISDFVDQFTEVTDCCDLQCPTTCTNQGDVVTSDCGVCFDWNSHYVSGQLLVSLLNVTPGISQNAAGTLSGTVEPTQYRATNVVVSAASASSLEVEFDLEIDWYRSIASQNYPADCSYPSSIEAFCCDECQGETGSCPQTWTVKRTGCKITVPCMGIGVSNTSSTTLVRPANTCSGNVNVSQGTGCPFPGANSSGSAAGWGAVLWTVYDATSTSSITPVQMNNTYNNQTAGSFDTRIQFAVSVAARDASCP